MQGIRIDDDKNVITNILFYENNENGKDASYGRYPIENGIITDRNNAWGYGKTLPWEEFKKNIMKDINDIIEGK